MNTRTIDHSNSADNRQALIESAVKDGIMRYIESRRTRVPAFVETHFSFKGALRLHRKALGKDLYKGPLNVLWAVPSLAATTAASVLKKIGAQRPAGWLDKLPKGFETDVQKEVNWLIYTDLLELPYKQGERESTKDALLGEILNNPRLSGLIARYLIEINEKARSARFRGKLEENLKQYALSRTAAADLAGSIISLSAGFVGLHQVTPGALAAGSATAAALAQQIAISNFWLGTTLGGWYYALFPAAASTGLVIAATGSIMAALAIIATFAGVVTDPLQTKTGLHQKRLLKLIDALQDELSGEGAARFHLKDHYVARVFDLIDLLKLAAKGL